jgi:hypothetical protein
VRPELALVPSLALVAALFNRGRLDAVPALLRTEVAAEKVDTRVAAAAPVFDHIIGKVGGDGAKGVTRGGFL